MCIQQERRRLCNWQLVPLLIVLSVAGFAADGAAAEPQKAVLALYAERPDLPANVIVDEIIRSTLERELGSRLDFYTEFLDTARWPEGEAQAAVHDLLRRKYAQKKFGAIIAVARPAINFIRVYGNDLFPGVPIVVFGDSDALRDWEPGRPITGALAKVDLGETVDLILSLQPGTREIIVISGVSDSDRWRQSETRRQLARFEKSVKLTYMDAGSAEDFLRTVARVPDGTAILFLTMYQDSAGNKLLSDEVLARIAREARVPVYNQTATHVGLGIVGGVVFDPAALARETAQVTLRVLRGERLQDLPVQVTESTVPMVDWRQLRRWGLNEKRLPAGTVVRFREVSVWESYKWYIIGGISLILVEALLIFSLLWQRTRRRHAETELAITYDRLRMSVEAGRFVGWDFDVKTGSHRWFGDLEGIFGIRSHNYSGPVDEFRRRVHPDDLDSVLKEIDRARQSRQPYTAEFRIVRDDGTVRWIIARGKFYYASNGDPERMLGLALDITERKMAEGALSNLSSRLIEAQEEERSRIARELHDDYNQRLAMMAIDLERLAEEMDGSSAEAAQQLHELFNRTSELGADLHSLSHSLHSSTLESLGLVAGVRAFCEEFAEQQEIQVDFAHENVPRGIPADVALCMFRIAQEALRNVKRHSGTDRAEVRLEWLDGKLHLSVSDRGRGFDSNRSSPDAGIGLRSMEERLRLLGGQFEIYSRPMEGARIDAWLPFQVASQRAS